MNSGYSVGGGETNFLVGFCFLGLSEVGVLSSLSSLAISLSSCLISFSSFLISRFICVVSFSICLISCWIVCFFLGVLGVVIGGAFCLVNHVDAGEVADGV